ncbi:fructosamine kinase family protein [Verrucomicrobiaceae bacterium N1E253]|uniref:Fructosamine kinase family protein n=1 Tax=Oceaniferula marina TaxID=2748318 RepID=A0A851GHX3_9BACT|nr:fructosamine kinase family protein [Oceaniferula marina]NWK56956.1 fructosamine kinase family protein [Oceaniferula marina]
MIWDHLRKQLSNDAIGSLGTPTPISGGCISKAFHWGPYFVKTNHITHSAMFRAESDGLMAIADSRCVTTPVVILCSEYDSQAYLVLDHIDMGAPPNPRQLGKELTRMHQQTARNHARPTFGWHQDNFIGSTPQNNGWNANWSDFWRKQRLEPMLNRCLNLGFEFPRSQQLLERIPDILADHHPAPSLVHGDLWTGNADYTTNKTSGSSTPVLFDPAVYLGDREVDLAMSELFGSFGPAFWKGVDEVWPLPPGYQRRRELYNLYHILNHTVLFGASYANQAQTMILNLCR